MSMSTRRNFKGPARSKTASTARGASDAKTTLHALAETYAKVADRLVDEIHEHADDRTSTRMLSRHLDWVGTRAQLVDRFIKAGDTAMTYIYAVDDAPARLLPLVQLTARHAATPNKLPVALFLLEKIDEELRLI